MYYFAVKSELSRGRSKTEAGIIVYLLNDIIIVYTSSLFHFN